MSTALIPILLITAAFSAFLPVNNFTYYYYVNPDETGPIRDTVIESGCANYGRGCEIFVKDIGRRQLFIKTDGILIPVTDR
ncbi:hypothetical protein [Chitinophaga defluvii]|uniref:Uncharacterized protein n=1 Tax=Chitinophaga defluvii TaxID=3163343 RepID=A0ABV2TCD9_9BACT